jgi:aminoglycoside 3-N-acetyltransferase
MSEAEIIRKTPEPRTIDSLSRDLRLLGLAKGTTVIVHSSLSAIGWVCGGSVALVRALMDVVTAEGISGAGRFSAGKGRHGDFADIHR